MACPFGVRTLDHTFSKTGRNGSQPGETASNALAAPKTSTSDAAQRRATERAEGTSRPTWIEPRLGASAYDADTAALATDRGRLRITRASAPVGATSRASAMHDNLPCRAKGHATLVHASSAAAHVRLVRGHDTRAARLQCNGARPSTRSSASARRHAAFRVGGRTHCNFLVGRRARWGSGRAGEPVIAVPARPTTEHGSSRGTFDPPRVAGAGRPHDAPGEGRTTTPPPRIVSASLDDARFQGVGTGAPASLRRPRSAHIVLAPRPTTLGPRASNSL